MVREARLRVEDELEATERRAIHAQLHASQGLDGHGTRDLRQAVSLHERTAKGCPNELLHFAGDGASTAERELEIPANHGSHWLEDQGIEQGRVPPLLDRDGAQLDGELQKEPLPRRPPLGLLLRALHDAFPDFGHAGHACGAVDGQGAAGRGVRFARPGKEVGDVGVAQEVAEAQHRRLRNELQDVCQRQVGHVGFLAIDKVPRQDGVDARDASNKLGVPKRGEV
eukprot:scaffold310_cov307-Pinguiococcus_pyrenoidosus.AAC.12